MIFNYLSGLEEDCGNLSVNEVFEFAMKAACKCMNGKRAEMLRLISVQNQQKTITSIVDDISHSLDCPKSTVWANINFLKEFGLIQNGRGRPVSLTSLGRLVLEKVAGRGTGVSDGFVPQSGMMVYNETEEGNVEVLEEEMSE
jgi:Mn-dependent DtxR family transcriptional regulator